MQSVESACSGELPSELNDDDANEAGHNQTEDEAVDEDHFSYFVTVVVVHGGPPCG